MALDLSTVSTGVVVGANAWHSDRPYIFTVKPEEPKAPVAQRIQSIATQLALTAQNNRVDRVVIERLSSVRNGRTTRVLAMLHGAVLQAIHLYAPSAVVLWVHQSSAIAHIGAKRGKDGTAKRVRALGYAFKNQDEADALCIFLSEKLGEPL
jgi:Holliday junction resolvasome RuvABC endonuclease subunit